MPPSTSKIAIIGGHSAVATQLRAGPLPDAAAFVRSGARAGERLVIDYRAMGPGELRGFGAVINCAGAVDGTADELERANVELAAALARSCREAGVRRLVHISSFSVYGPAASIGERTEPNPQSAYGRSKLRGDEAVLALSREGDVEVIVARFPAIIDASRRKGKVARLLAAWRKVGFLPVPAGDVRRSMISSALAARVLADLATAGGPRIVLAADPEPFTYARTAAAIGGATGRRVRAVRFPPVAFAPLRLFAPSLAASLLDDSLLDPVSNFANDYPSDLYDTLGALICPREST